MKYNKAIELLRKYLLGKADAAEEKKVEDWYTNIDESAAENLDANQLKNTQHQIYEKIQAELHNEESSPAPIVPLYRRLKWLAAASVIAAISITAFLVYKNNTSFNTTTGTKPATLAHDVKAPSSNKAVLKLADGSQVFLDSTAAGTLAMQGSVKVVKLADGRIRYHGTAGDEVAYNTLTVPKGSTPVKLLLADGSEVWLNVASSITYPTAFVGNERVVEISGEAYFEVAKNKEMPFVVKRINSDAQVKVLGTHFNINAYDDEAAMKVTLLEGSVDVSSSVDHNIIKPNQQAVLNAAGISVLNDVDVEEVMAWKNGRFYFESADIKTIMRQVEKWYNVKVEYQSDIKYSFVAKISRDVNASELLHILELTELVHFKINGDKITVTQ